MQLAVGTGFDDLCHRPDGFRGEQVGCAFAEAFAPDARPRGDQAVPGAAVEDSPGATAALGCSRAERECPRARLQTAQPWHPEGRDALATRNMQNIHTHAWDQALHFAAGDGARGGPLARVSARPDGPLRAVHASRWSRSSGWPSSASRPGGRATGCRMSTSPTSWPRRRRSWSGFASCDPTQPAHMEELRHGIEDLHLRGLKLGPIYAGFDPRDERLRAGLPLLPGARPADRLSHGHDVQPRGAARLQPAAGCSTRSPSGIPDLRIVLAHLGHPFCEECLCVIRKHPHVYADISALYYRPWQFYNMLMLAQEYR